MIYCIEHAEEGLDGTAQMFREALEGNHGAVIQDCLSILQNRFTGDEKVEGHRKDGPVAAARFEIPERNEADQSEFQILRQREVNSMIEQLLALIN